MAKTLIQWCDYSWNPWIGCRKVAPECANCYAETLDRNRYSKTLAPGTKENPVSHWGSGPRHRTKTWKNPILWNKTAICTACGGVEFVGSDDCRQCGRNFSAEHRRRPRVFCASLADWLDDENVPIEWLADLLKLIHDTPHLDWLLLTKRPQNFRSRLGVAHDWLLAQDRDQELRVWIVKWCVRAFGMTPEPPANVWIGVSAGADQAAALAIPARVHFLSCEPMLRPMDTKHAARFDWIIFGGESGKHARPTDIQWIRDGVKLCRDRGIAPFVKQMGAHLIHEKYPMAEREFSNFGRVENFDFKDSHGGDMDEWPEDLRVRCFPEVSR